jgi:hypothetical protein
MDTAGAVTELDPDVEAVLPKPNFTPSPQALIIASSTSAATPDANRTDPAGTAIASLQSLLKNLAT